MTTAEHADELTGTVEFVVRPDGTVVGDDGASGALAAALPYTGRLARQMGELVDAGDLRVVEALGLRRLVVGVTWTPAGEGTFRSVVVPLAARTVPTFTVVGAVDTPAAVAHCLHRLTAVDGVAWASLTTSSSLVVGAVGDRQDLHHLAEVGTRMLGVLRSLEDQHATGFVRLRFEQGALVGALVGRHALVARASTAADEDVLAVVDEIRAILTGHDLSVVPPEPDPDAPDASDLDAVPAGPPPLVGARFGKPSGPERPRGRRRFGTR